MPQPIWFGLTQKQEAEAGFDAATRLHGSRLLLLQFKAGRKLKDGSVRFTAPHGQLSALQSRLKMHRLIYYVLPGVTETGDLTRPPWVLAQTWFLDVAAIPTLSAPTRKSQCHHVTLNPKNGAVLITSDPVRTEAVGWEYIARNANPLALGATFENFEKFWAYAQVLRRGGAAVSLPGV